MAATGNQQDFNARLMCAAQSSQICLGDMKLRIQQSAVNIHGQETDGRSHCKNSNIGKRAAGGQLPVISNTDCGQASLKSPTLTTNHCPPNTDSVIFRRLYGVVLLTLVSLGFHSSGDSHCPLHPAPPGYLLAVDHSYWWRARRDRVYRGRSVARYWAAARIG